MRQQGCGQVILGILFILVACAVFASLAGAMVRTGEIPLHGPRLTGFEPDPDQPFLPSTPITFTFDQPMMPASVEALVSLESSGVNASGQPVPGAFHWNENHTQVTFVPENEGFAPGATYTIQLLAGAKAGTLPRTTTDSIRWSITLSPLLDSMTPSSGEQEVDAWPVLQATFNYALDCETTLATYAISPPATGKLSCDGHTVTFSPTLPLAPGVAYLAEVSSLVLGDGWPRPGVTWEFETAPPLTIEAFSPTDGGSLTDLWTPVRIAFNRPVVAESVQKRFTLTGEGGTVLEGQVSWEDQGATFVFQPQTALAPASSYRFHVQAGVRDKLGFELTEPLVHTFETESLLTEVAPHDGAREVNLDSLVRITFSRPMDQDSLAQGLTFTPPLKGGLAWEENTVVFSPHGGLAADTQYEVTVSADVRDASGAPLAESHTWSFDTQPFLLTARPPSKTTLTELRHPLEFEFALPMDRGSVRGALTISPETAVDLTWSDEDRSVSVQPDSAWLPGADYGVILSASARTADGLQSMARDYTVTFTTAYAEVQFGEGPNVQVLDAKGERAFQVVARGADVADYVLYAITPTQFLDLYSSGFRGIGPREAQLIDTSALTPTVQWRDVLIPTDDEPRAGWQAAEARIPADVPPGMYILTAPLPTRNGEEGTQDSLLVILTNHALVLKQALAGSGSHAEANIVGWDTTMSDASPIVSATVRLYDRDNTFLAEGLTSNDGLLSIDVPGDPGPLIALSNKDDDWTVCGLSNEWSEAGWWWWWTQPASRPLYTIYSHTDRPIYRPAQTVYFKEYVRADDDVRYTLPGPDVPITVRLRDARDNVAATQVLTSTRFGTVYGEFQLAEEPILGTWNLETELEGTVTRQPLKVEEYRKPEYNVSVHTPQEAYVYGEEISVTVDAAYYFGQPVAGAQVTLQIYPTYAESFDGADEPQVGYPILTEQDRLGADGRWAILVPTEKVFYEGSQARRAALALEATVTDESGQSVSTYETVVVLRTSQGLTLLLEKHGYQPSETISFSASVRDREDEPSAGVELTAEVLGWDGKVVASGKATTGDTGQAFFSVQIADQGWYDVQVVGIDDGGREIRAADHVWVYDPSGQAPWYQGRWAEGSALAVGADRSTYDVGDEARIVVYAPAPGPALLTVERGKTHHAEPISLISGTNLITVPIRADYAPNVDITVNQFGPLSPGWWGIQSRPEAQLNKASTEILVPMTDRLLTVTLTADQDIYDPGDQATFHIQVTNLEGQPVVAEISLAIVDEAIYALAEDMSRDPFKVFYAPRPNLVRTFDSLRPSRWLYPEGPGLGGGDEEGGAPRRDFLDTAYWTPIVVTDENGEAAITFELPDNLTEWRALARAITTDTLVGQSTTSIVVSKDIIVRPTLPRFLVHGDAITLTAVVHNFTDRPMSAIVELEVEGLAPAWEEGQATKEQVVEVPAGGSATVGWPVRAGAPVDDDQDTPEEARILIQATAFYGARRIGSDAVELSLPLIPLAVPEVATFAGTLTPERPTKTITIPISADAIEGLSRLEINLAPSVAPGLLNGLEYLIDYPFG